MSNHSFKLLILAVIQMMIASINTQKLIQQQSSTDFVYSQFFLRKFDITEPQGASTKIKTALKANLVFISAGMEGILIIDTITNQIIFKYPTTVFINTIEATSDGDYLITSFNSKVTLMSFKDRKSLQILSQCDFPSSLTDIVIDNQEKRIYAVGMEGIVAAYDIQDKRNMYQLTVLNVKSVLVHSASISPDDNWLLLGNDERGLSILKIIIQDNNLNDNQQASNYKLSFLLAAEGIGFWKIIGARMTKDMDYIYSIENWYGIFICEFTYIMKSDPSLYPLPITFKNVWPYKKINPSIYSIALMRNSDYLLVGVRSQGVYIFNIKDKMNPVIFQTIPVGANAFSIAFSPNEEYLYYANAESVYVFQKTPINLNNHFPNLFNEQQSIFENTSEAFYKWRCQVQEINGKTYYFGAFDYTGFTIFDVSDPYNFKKIFSKSYKMSSLVDSLTLSPNQRYLFIPIQEDKTSIVVFDIIDIQNPVEVYRFKMEQPNHNEIIFVSKDGQLLALTFDDGVLLIDSSRMPELQLLDYWKKFVYMKGENAGVMLTSDNKYLIGCVRGYGYYVLSIDLDHKTEVLQWKYTLQTLGGEGIIPSLHDDRYAYFFDGYHGVGVIDINALPRIQVLSQVSLVGWSNMIIPILDDNYLIVAQLEAGMISLIDSSDKTNLILISSFQYQEQSAQSICITKDFNYIFINNNLGTLMLPLQSQLKIHTEIQQITINSKGKAQYQPLKGNQFIVGQQIKMKFLMLYPTEGMKIVETYYIQNQQIKNIPSWIAFDRENQELIITVDKTAIGDNQTMNSLNVILVKSAIPILSNYFIFNLEDGTSTSEADSLAILSALKEKQVINNKNFVSDSFDYSSELSVSINGSILQKSVQRAIKRQLQMSVSVNQVLFYVQPSLKLDLTDPLQHIKTLSSYLQIFFQVDNNVGQFLTQNFQGVIVSGSEMQDQLKLEGYLEQINKALEQKVIFATKSNPKLIDVRITIIDGINYPITHSTKISECQLIKEKEQIKKNPQLSLQSQFNKKYSEGVIFIKEQFSIEFEPRSFIVNDVQKLNHRGYIIQGDEKTEILQDSWLQFSSINGNIQIQGIPSVSQLYQAVHIRIEADDGYTTGYDTFTIYISGVPFLYVMNLLLQILGPFLALTKLYMSRYIFLNCLNKKNVTFSPENVESGILYSKKLVIMGDDMKKCIFLFQGFIQEWKRRIKNKNRQQNTKNKNQQQQGNDCQCSDLETNSPEFANGLNNNISKSIAKTSEESFDQILNSSLKLKGDQQNSNKYSKKIIDLFNKYSSIQIQNKNISQLEKEFIDQNDGSIKMRVIIQYILKSKLSFHIKGKKYPASLFALDLKNNDSRIYRGIQALAARYLLRKNACTYLVYKYLKRYSLDNYSYTQNDWYRALVKIYSTERKDNYGFQIPFPDLSLKEDSINLILAELQSYKNVSITIDTLRNLGVNFNLIKEVLFADTLGLVEYIPKRLQPCIGESIHLHSYQIRGVQTYKKVKDSRLSLLRKAMNLEYKEYGTSKNRSLPNWMDLDHNNGIILLQGIPMSQDAEEILIRITSSKEYVIKQFILNISERSDVSEQQIFNNDSLEQDLPINSILFNSFTKPIKRQSMNKILFEKISSLKQTSSFQRNEMNYSKEQIFQSKLLRQKSQQVDQISYITSKNDLTKDNFTPILSAKDLRRSMFSNEKRLGTKNQISSENPYGNNLSKQDLIDNETNPNIQQNVEQDYYLIKNRIENYNNLQQNENTYIKQQNLVCKNNDSLNLKENNNKTIYLEDRIQSTVSLDSIEQQQQSENISIPNIRESFFQFKSTNYTLQNKINQSKQHSNNNA